MRIDPSDVTDEIEAIVEIAEIERLQPLERMLPPKTREVTANVDA